MIEHDHDRTAAYHAATVAYEADKAALQRARCDEADRRNALWQQTKGARRREYNALTAADDTLATLKAATRAAYETSVQAREECEATAAQVPIAAQTNLGPFTRLITIARVSPTYESFITPAMQIEELLLDDELANHVVDDGPKGFWAQWHGTRPRRSLADEAITRKAAE